MPPDNSSQGSETADERLAPRSSDYVAAAARAVLGAAPFVGSLLNELVGVVVPNQRADRIAKFVLELEARIKPLEAQATEKLHSSEHFAELLEEGLRQASRSLSDERRQYLASLIANSISPEAIAQEESRHLLRILSELSDVEVVWLRFYVDQAMGGDREFREKHRDILRPASRSMGQPQSETDRAALQESYINHLTQLGLLDAEASRAGSTADRMIYRISSLGRLLLRTIGLQSRRVT